MSADLAALRRHAPLVHLYTNPVALSLTANLLAAVGAVPAAREAVDTSDTPRGPDAVLVNLGVGTAARRSTWLAAAQQANTSAVPWVLDPVGANSIYPAQRAIAAELVALHPAVVRGNASEISALGGGELTGRGPDSALSPGQVVGEASWLAAQRSTVVAVSGATDLVTDGARLVAVPGGHEWMPRASSLGCALGALVAAFAAVAPSALRAAVSASAVMAEAGARAGLRADGPGTLAPHLIDALFALEP